ncbi:DNA polymerase III subunit beta, partial [Ochrobactrum sp. SFR4]|nr:DNA polymerase III subunit beta [Ochrobactrum sp. SFR4]
SAQLHKALSKVAPSISTEETRYYLNGVYMHIPERSNELTFVATDGHRLARYEVPAPDGSEAMPDAGIIIPRKTVMELLRLLSRKACPESTLITVADIGVSFLI